MIELKVDVADPDLEAALQLEESQPPRVWDCIERRTIPAFPGSRPNASHLKTADDVAWHPEYGQTRDSNFASAPNSPGRA